MRSRIVAEHRMKCVQIQIDSCRGLWRTGNVGSFNLSNCHHWLVMLTRSKGWVVFRSLRTILRLCQAVYVLSSRSAWTIVKPRIFYLVKVTTTLCLRGVPFPHVSHDKNYGPYITIFI